MNARIHWARTSALAAMLLLTTCQYPLRNATAQAPVQSSTHYKCVACPGGPLMDRNALFPDGPDGRINVLPQRPVNTFKAEMQQVNRVPDEPPPRPEKVLVVFDRGGLISEYDYRWRMVRRDGKDVEVIGVCESACTFVLSWIEKDKLCIGGNAMFAFHSARYSNSRPALQATQYMYDSYPPDIRNWIDRKGGYANLPLDGYWFLPAKELWAMGYRRCQ
jgi:hypothetical protein